MHFVTARNRTILTPGDGREQACPTQAEPSANRIRVWLVDDHKGVRELLAELLEVHEGFECGRQFDSAEALLEALAVDAPPDVILLDNQMGGITGLEALRPVRRLAPSTRVLMLTSCCDGTTKAQALRDGASDFLSKGRDVTEIARRTRLAMAGPPPPIPSGDRPESQPAGVATVATKKRSVERRGFKATEFWRRRRMRRRDLHAARYTRSWQGRAWVSLVGGVHRLRTMLNRTRAEL
jgi:DNA-binding NarL/FixJ family response regulator